MYVHVRVRVHVCVIVRVCVRVCRPAAKDAQYAEVIRLGDQLLNQVQKLSRVIDIE